MTAGLAALERKIAKFHPEANYPLIEKAYQFAEEHHAGQVRLSNQPYLTHVVATAQILTELHLDDVTIASALLHDVIEDTAVEPEEIRAEFGDEIASLVEGVTKLSSLKFKSSEEHLAENLRKMFMAMAKDVRVLLIKLADRLHNMRTIEFLPPEKQRRISKETVEIYAPLAHRLGIGMFKVELEDLALRYLHPKVYNMIVESINKTRSEHEEGIKQYIKPLRKKLKQVGIKGEISGRPKHFFSIYQKMQRKKVDINKIYDLTAVRVITNDLKDCYGALGIIHTLWKPMPGRFKDYIAVSKPNMYQSLHTTVFGSEGEAVEFQIRTREMHQIAEEGIAAHWCYKERKTGKELLNEAEKFAWLRHLLELKDPKEFMESLKIDLYEDQVFVFTPKGEVIELPRGSTPVDFAYAIHTAVGTSCIGAKVNGKIVPLKYKLANGNIVSVLTSKQGKPNRDWLKFVKTSKARSRIRAYVRQTERLTSIQIGFDQLEAELKKRGVYKAILMKSESLHALAETMGLSKADDMLAEIGFGQMAATRVAKVLCPELEKKIPSYVSDVKEKPTSGRAGVRVEGFDDQLQLRLSKCCSPVPGDKIIGLITHGRGVTVHRADCLNTVNFDPQNLVDVEWYSTKDGTYDVSIEADCFDRANLLADVLKVIHDQKIIISSASAWSTKDNMAKCRFLVEISDITQLDDLIKKIESVRGIMSAKRSNPG